MASTWNHKFLEHHSSVSQWRAANVVRCRTSVSLNISKQTCRAQQRGDIVSTEETKRDVASPSTKSHRPSAHQADSLAASDAHGLKRLSIAIEMKPEMAGVDMRQQSVIGARIHQHGHTNPVVEFPNGMSPEKECFHR